MTKLMLLDTASMYYRAFHSMPESMVSKDGTPVNAVRGLLERIIRLQNERRPDRIIAAWDTEWRPQWRVDLIPSYKTHRVEIEDADDDSGTTASTSLMPDALSVQIPIIEEILTALGIPVIGHENYEADDVIGTYSTASTYDMVEIVSGDRDLFQLIDDKKGVSVLYTSKGNVEEYREGQVESKYGIRANQYSDYAILRGDPSDGLPGVKGIGEKTAAKLLQDFITLDTLLEQAERKNSGIKPRIAENLVDSIDYIRKAQQVVPVVKDVDLPLLSNIEITPIPKEILIRTAEDLNMKSLMLKAINIFSIN